MWKKRTPLWREAHFGSQNVQNTRSFESLLEVEMFKKCTALWREAHFEVKMLKAHHVRSNFWKLRCSTSARRCGTKHGRNSKVLKIEGFGVSRTPFWSYSVVLRGRRKGFGILPKVSKTWGFCGSFKNVGRRGTLGRGSAKMHAAWQAQYKRHDRHGSSEMLGGLSADFLRGVAFWSNQIFRCVNSSWQVQHFVWPGLTFSWQAQYFRTHGLEKLQNALARGRQLCTLPLLKISQNCFVFDVVNFESWGRLADLLRFWLRKSPEMLRFWCFQVPKLKTSRQHSFVSKLTDR